MIRRFVVIVAVLSIMITPIYADEIIASSEGENDSFSFEEYIPSELSGLLDEYGVDDAEEIDSAYILNLIIGFLKEAAKGVTDELCGLIACLVIISVIRNTIDNTYILLSINVLSLVINAIFVTSVISTLFGSLKNMLDSDLALISALAPSFAAIKLSGGAVSSAAGSTYSFGIIITVLEMLISLPVRNLLGFVCAFFIAERLSPFVSEMKLTKRMKKHITVFITFICTVLTTVLSIQNVLTSRADSVAVRGVRFASSSFIPIVGGALGESIKTVSYGLGYVKSTVGALATFGVFVTVFPTVIGFFVSKLLVSLLSLFSQSIGCEKESSFLSELCDLIDIFLAIAVCSFVLSFVLTYLFTVTAF